MEVKYAGFWIRAAACLIDGILINIGIFLAVIPIGILVGIAGYADSIDENNPLWHLVSFLIGLGYEAYMTSSKFEGTFGKVIVNIKVVDENGQRISFMRSVGRYFAKIISCLTFMIGFFLAGWTKKKTALHDMIASTYVVYRG